MHLDQTAPYLTAALLILIAVPAHAQEQVDSLPPDVTEAMLEEGATLFAGPGLCFACHGPDAGGVTGVGPSLTDGEWLTGSGSLDDIDQQIRDGVTPETSKTGGVMPPRGGSTLTDEQVRAVAAYVWSLSIPGADPD